MPLSKNKHIILAVTIAALGYFVDVYDLALFSVVRVSSLKELGLEGDALLMQGAFLLNCQMAGMFLGGIVFGILGDKKGRLQVLFGSILLYSVANIANAFVDTVPAYAFWRFAAGFGLAGELGAGITLVAELMPKKYRGYGTTAVATVGVAGGVVAALVGGAFHWRTAYIVGGVLGLALLVLRLSVHESGLFSALLKKENVSRGSLKMLLFSRERVLRYLSCILTGVPAWYFVGIIVTFSPEIGAALGITETLSPARGILLAYIGFVVGDLFWGLLSQRVQSRKKPLAAALAGSFAGTLVLLNLSGGTAFVYYSFCLLLGCFHGCWVLFVTTAAEQFGTNLRATVATSVPNFVRGFTVICTLLFTQLKPLAGVTQSALIVGLVMYALAAIGLWRLKESFATDLAFVESR